MCAKLLGGGGCCIEVRSRPPQRDLGSFYSTTKQLLHFFFFYKLQLLGVLGVSVYCNKLYLSWWVVGGLLGRVFWGIIQLAGDPTAYSTQDTREGI